MYFTSLRLKLNPTPSSKLKYNEKKLWAAREEGGTISDWLLGDCRMSKLLLVAYLFWVIGVKSTLHKSKHRSCEAEWRQRQQDSGFVFLFAEQPFPCFTYPTQLRGHLASTCWLTPKK